jgi:hypothetical protein
MYVIVACRRATINIWVDFDARGETRRLGSSAFITHFEPPP